MSAFVCVFVCLSVRHVSMCVCVCVCTRSDGCPRLLYLLCTCAHPAISAPGILVIYVFYNYVYMLSYVFGGIVIISTTGQAAGIRLHGFMCCY